MIRFIIFIFSIIFLASCASPKLLISSLGKIKVPINYLYDSKTNDCPKKDTILINGISKLNFDKKTNITKQSKKVVPLLVVNYSELKLDVKLGQSSFDENYGDFFINSFIKESQRTGCFVTNKNSSNKDRYSLDISIDSCITTSQYQYTSTVIFLLIFFSSSSNEFALPSNTSLNLNIALRKDSNIVFTKNYNFERQQPFIFEKVDTPKKLRSDFVTNMVESLSLTTKQCIEIIINDLNEYLNKKE